MVNVAVPPASVVTSPDVGVTVIPPASLSRVRDRDVGRVDRRVAGSVLAAASLMVYALAPSTTASFTPVTVTVCAVLQLARVKVTLPGATVPSVVSPLETVIVTFAVGCDASTSWNVAVPPASVVVTSPTTG